MVILDESKRNHIYNTTKYLYMKRGDGGSFCICSTSELLKGSVVKIYDAETGDRLETERGDDVFTLSQDYNGKTRIPFFY